MTVRIIYVSQASPTVGQVDVERLVTLSSERNAFYGITGVLAFDGGRFVQILEGPGSQVENLYARIRADGRHEGVVTLAHDNIDAPHFPNWMMVRRAITDVLLLIDDLG